MFKIYLVLWCIFADLACFFNFFWTLVMLFVVLLALLILNLPADFDLELVLFVVYTFTCFRDLLKFLGKFFLDEFVTNTVLLYGLLEAVEIEFVL